MKKLLPDIDLLPPQSSPSTKSHISPPALSQFEESLNNDALAAGFLAHKLDMSSVDEVVNALDQCEGQFLISGVGTYLAIIIVLYYYYNYNYYNCRIIIHNSKENSKF